MLSKALCLELIALNVKICENHLLLLIPNCTCFSLFIKDFLEETWLHTAIDNRFRLFNFMRRREVSFILGC
jgi:hypothetical protein